MTKKKSDVVQISRAVIRLGLLGARIHIGDAPSEQATYRAFAKFVNKAWKTEVSNRLFRGIDRSFSKPKLPDFDRASEEVEVSAEDLEEEIDHVSQVDDGGVKTGRISSHTPSFDRIYGETDNHWPVKPVPPATKPEE